MELKQKQVALRRTETSSTQTQQKTAKEEYLNGTSSFGFQCLSHSLPQNPTPLPLAFIYPSTMPVPCYFLPEEDLDWSECFSLSIWFPWIWIEL